MVNSVEEGGCSELRVSPSLVLVDNSLFIEDKGALLDGLGLNDFGDKATLDENVIEIDLVGCDVLDFSGDTLCGGNRGQQRGVVGPEDVNEKRVGSRYEASDVQVSAKLPGFFRDKALSQASLVDFSQDGIGLICNEQFSVNTKIKLSLEFAEAVFFEVVGVVVRSELSALVEGSYLNGIKLDESVQLFKDRVLEEGLRRKLG